VTIATLGPLFVVGNSRSGTTMMGRILGHHPQVRTFNELHFFEGMWSPERDSATLDEAHAVALASRLLAIERHDYLIPGDPTAYREEARHLVAALPTPVSAFTLFEAFLDHELTRSGRTVACDQTPRNVYFAPLLLESFPNAHIVHMVRDPRDVLLSQKNRWRRRRLSARQGSIPLLRPLTTWANYHPITIGLLWNSGVAAARRSEGHPRFHTVRFETLVADPERAVRELCRELGLAYRDDMLAVPRVGSSLQRDDPTRLGIDADAAGRFHLGGLAPAEIALAERLTGDRMAAYGYAPSGVRAPLGAALLTLLWPFKSALALLLNARRSRNLLASIRRRLRR
jgi:hypothetical protein